MNSFLERAAAPARMGLCLFALLGVLSMLTGCGAISAATNPKVAWALNDPAPMTVVVRRADAADATSKQVDRILASTPADPTSDWMKNVAPKPEDAAGEVKAVSVIPFYATSRARVIPAEVWARTLPDVQSTSGASPNMLAMMDADLGAKYGAIVEKQNAIADAQAQIAQERAAKDAKDATDADKKEHDANIDKLTKQSSSLEDEIAPLRKAFIAAAKDAAKKTPAEARDGVGSALVNLRQAVDDAQIAIGAAAIRYPLALSSLPDSTKQMVPVFVADIVEEKTGKRPAMQGLKPDVSLDGTNVKLTLNGLSQDDLGKINMGDLTSQTVDRTQKWVKHAVGLLGSVGVTKENLSFSADALDAMIDGVVASGWTKVAAAKIPDSNDPSVKTAAPKTRTASGAPTTAVSTTAVTNADVTTSAGSKTTAPAKPAKGNKGQKQPKTSSKGAPTSA